MVLSQKCSAGGVKVDGVVIILGDGGNTLHLFCIIELVVGSKKLKISLMLVLTPVS